MNVFDIESFFINLMHVSISNLNTLPCSHFPHRLYSEMLDDMVPKKPPMPEETLGEPMKWKITGTSTLLLMMLRMSATFLVLSSLTFSLASALLNESSAALILALYVLCEK